MSFRNAVAIPFMLMLSAAPAMAVVQPTVAVLMRPNADGTCDDISAPTNCENNLLAREAQVGHLIGMAAYVPFDFTSIPTLEWAYDGGRPIQITWQHTTNGNGCATAVDVAAGVYDTQLISQMTYVATRFPNGGWIRFIPEMDKTHQTCFDGVDPEVDPVTAGTNFKPAFTHFHDLLKTYAPTWKAEFAPGAGAFDDGGSPSSLWLDFFPGAANVDEICTDPYNRSANTAQNVLTWPVFNNFYSQAAVYGVPLCFAEYGAINNDSVSPNPQQKMNYSIYANFKASYPLMRNITYFDVLTNPWDFRLGGGGLTAFTNMMDKVYFQRQHP